MRMVAMTGDTAASSLRMMLFMVLSFLADFAAMFSTGGPSLLKVSRSMSNSENEFISKASSSFGTRRPTHVFLPLDTRRSRKTNSFADIDRLVGDEDEHVPDLFGLVLPHRENDRVGASRAEVVHEDVQELAQDLRVVVDREAVDRVQDDEGVAARVLAEDELDLEHDVLEHRRALDDDRVGMTLLRRHHDLADAIDEPDVIHRDLEDLEGADDALTRDRRRDVDNLQVLLPREPVEHALDRIEILFRLQPHRNRRGIGERGQFVRDVRGDAHTSHPSPRSRLSREAQGGRRMSSDRGHTSRGCGSFRASSRPAASSGGPRAVRCSPSRSRRPRWPLRRPTANSPRPRIESRRRGGTCSLWRSARSRGAGGSRGSALDP